MQKLLLHVVKILSSFKLKTLIWKIHFRFWLIYFWTVYSGDIDNSDFVYGNLLEVYYNKSDSDIDDSDSGDLKVTVCCKLFEGDLNFEKFCISCKNIFKKSFNKNLHLISNKKSVWFRKKCDQLSKCLIDFLTLCVIVHQLIMLSTVHFTKCFDIILMEITFCFLYQVMENFMSHVEIFWLILDSWYVILKTCIHFLN